MFPLLEEYIEKVRNSVKFNMLLSFFFVFFFVNKQFSHEGEPGKKKKMHGYIYMYLFIK